LIQERFEDWVGHGIFNVDGEEWKHQRKVATAEFASSKLRDFSVHVYRSEALKLIQVLSIAAKNHQTVDLQVYCLFLRQGQFLQRHMRFAQTDYLFKIAWDAGFVHEIDTGHNLQDWVWCQRGILITIAPGGAICKSL
jgi:hypothetical protein